MARETAPKTEQQLFLDSLDGKTLAEIRGYIAHRKMGKQKGEPNPELDWEMRELEKRQSTLEEEFRQETATRSLKDLEISIEVMKWKLEQLEAARKKLASQNRPQEQPAPPITVKTAYEEKPKASLPDYASKEEIERDKELIKIALTEKISESLEAMTEFKNRLFSRGEERRQQMLLEYPEYKAFENMEKDQPNPSARYSRVYAKGKDGNWVNDPFDTTVPANAPEPGVVGVYVEGSLHHKPEEEVLAATLGLATYDNKTNDIKKREFLFSAGDNEHEYLNLFSGKEFKDAAEFYNHLRVFFSRQIFHQLFRTEYLIKTYYPDNEEYGKFIKPIEELRLMLQKIGIEVPSSPLLQIVEDKDIDPKSDKYVGVYDSILAYVPTIARKAFGVRKAELERRGSNQAGSFTVVVDVRYAGFKINDKLVPSESGLSDLKAGSILYNPSEMENNLNSFDSVRSRIY